MRQVPGAKLWIGDADDASDRAALHAAGIVKVIDLASSPPSVPATGNNARLHFSLVDRAGNPPELLRDAINAVAELIRGGVPTLLCSSRGMSRSAAIAAAALAQVQNQDASETLAQVCIDCNVDVSGPLWFDIYSATHDGASFVFKMPPRTGKGAAEKEKPPGKRSVWPL